MVAIVWLNWWLQSRQRTISPYTGLPLRRASELSNFSTATIQRWLFSFSSYDNRPIDFNKAAFCRETGRIFPNAVTWFGEIKVDWNFLQKRCPGNWVSWGSLNFAQQEAIRRAHYSLDGFQIDQSSRAPIPRYIEDKYIYIKPGPLYADIESKVLLGWKCVPDTDLEVLIIQRPKDISEGIVA